MERDEAKVLAEVVTRHVQGRTDSAAKVFPGMIKTAADVNGVARWVQDGTGNDRDIGVTDKTGAAVNKRVLVQFNPSGAAFVLQRIT